MSFVTTPSGLRWQDTVVGQGRVAAGGDRVSVHYAGWLYENGAKGAKFDATRDRGETFEFTLGGGEVIAGWDEGVQGMRVGGSRSLVIPAHLAYGAQGAGGVIPPDATLWFEIDLLSC
jgi:FKBP-type peptidyl-prolyl cis-trans isomerase